MKKSYLGIYWSLAALAFYLFLNLFFVTQLPVKLDTFIVFSLVVLPGFFGGIIFHVMDNKGLLNDESSSLDKEVL